MSEITIQSDPDVLDTYIENNSPTSNYGTSEGLGVGEQKSITVIYRSLLKFDLSGIPSGSTITSAILTLNSDGQDLSDQSRTMRVYRVLRAWNVSQATWNVYTTGNNWGSAGCSNTSTDREATDIGSVTHPANPSSGDDIVITLTASSVEEMITDGGFINNGFLIQMDTESDDAGGFRSSQYGTEADRPKLVV